ncbi:unnamed protein product [Caenorhabditis sp. 36 PRJEB53466]|nr:unnamed protein product [Caenorhabditis sp. 36 PRJEB53466]
MDSIFSDDEEFDAFRDKLFDGQLEDENEKMVPMFGMYALIKMNNVQKPREDLFLRGMEPPSDYRDPYEQNSLEQKKPVLKKAIFADDFSFFGMKQKKINSEDNKASTANDCVSLRSKLLEKLKEQDEAKKAADEKERDEEDEYGPATSHRKPFQQRETNADTPRPVLRKRKRAVVSSWCGEDSDSERETRPPSPNLRSPRKKRVFRA